MGEKNVRADVEDDVTTIFFISMVYKGLYQCMSYYFHAAVFGASGVYLTKK